MTLPIQKLIVLLCCGLAFTAFGQEEDELAVGPLFSEFPLTLSSGYRCEAAGPLFYSQQSESQRQWALPPWLCYTRTEDVDWTEMEVLYPLLSYRRFGGEYRMQILEFISFSGGQTSAETGASRFTFFPFYFQQRALDTNLNYTAVVPFYGHLKNRLFRDEIKFIMFPLYSETRKKEVITDNYLFPVFDVRYGDHVKGWQVWPVFGVEHKKSSLRTNSLDEVETDGGYDKYFAAWPFYFQERGGLDTTNQTKSLAVVPFYCRNHSATRDVTSYGWPLGFNVIEDRAKNYEEHDFLWPLNVVARGDRTVTRVFPFYSQARNRDLESDFYLWPVYKFNRLESGPLERRRTRIMFFLYSDIVETNREAGGLFERTDFWPFYSVRRDMNGDYRWQTLAIVEPFFPNNRSMKREYSQVYSFWRCEKNNKTGASSQSLFWNLYRREATPHSKKCSLLFGLYQYQSGPDGQRWRVCHVTVGKKTARVTAPQS